MTSQSPFPIIRILRIPFHLVSTDDVFHFIEQRISQKNPAWACTPNPEIVVAAQTDAELAHAIEEADLSLPDGVALFWASRRLGVPLREKITGIDLGEALIKQAALKGYRIFFLGAAPGVAQAAAKRWKIRYPQLNVAGWQHGYYLREEEKRVIQSIRDARADILFVALGFPKQEMFLSRNYRDLAVPFSLTVGGAFDVWSGKTKRAPDWTRRLGIEWVYRLLQHPLRYRRQKNLIQFIWLVIRAPFSL